ncbi:hypothetical protein BU15DRAFT_80442 [Melanogaster broomeanus]|nr:hypothetical protein BU15DRAFT_80442 [Melanogaster broomeanus]
MTAQHAPNTPACKPHAIHATTVHNRDDNDSLTWTKCPSMDHLTGKPSAKDKTGIHEIIAKHIFEMDEDWAQQYTNSPKKFSTCVSNRISYLRKTFIKHYSKLNQTGQGVQPGDGAVNSHELVLKDFPWYNELYGTVDSDITHTARDSPRVWAMTEYGFRTRMDMDGQMKC